MKLLAFATGQLSFHGFADEVRSLLLFSQHRVDARKGAVAETSGSLLPIDSRPAHRRGNRRYHFFCQAVHFVDITYCQRK